MGLEGIVSKKLHSRYRSGRQRPGSRLKCFAEDDFVVIGTEQGVGPTTVLLARARQMPDWNMSAVRCSH
jgi:ATP-dependent DNA ligase